MKKLVSKSKTFILSVLLLSLFVVFQNFQSSKVPQACRAYINLNRSDYEILDLGEANKKSECLKNALAVLRSRHCLEDLTSDDLSRVQVVLKNEMLPREKPQIPAESRVAEFNCGAIQTKTFGPSNFESYTQKANREKFEALSQKVVPSSEIFTQEGFSFSCPGCYNTIQRRIAEDEFEVCHELTMVDQVAEEGKGLIVSNSQAFEYQCQTKEKAKENAN